MSRSADVLDQTTHSRVRCSRIRRPRTLRIKMLAPGEQAPPRRTNPHGWRHANAARCRQGRERTEAIARRWAQAGAAFPGNRGLVVALVSGTTRAAVYQRLYRLRHGFYDKPARANRSVAPPPPLRIDSMYERERRQP